MKEIFGGGSLPSTGKAFRTKSELGDVDTMFVKTKHCIHRAPDIIVTYKNWIPGGGGDLWWMVDANGNVAPYCFDELLELEPGDEGYVAV
jgi:hypothetical protein